MWRSWKLGTAFGIGIYVHWSFALLLAYAFVNGLLNGGTALALFMVPLALAVFGCVVLHELGHALMARHFGIGTRDITLYPIGGVARLERMTEDPLEEICIAVAGPAVNVVIAALLLPLCLLFSVGALSGLPLLPRGPEDLIGPGLVGVALFTLLVSNLVLAGFNMIPAFPMDGGRVLRALLAFSVDRLRATEIAVGVGTVMALGLATLGALPLLGVHTILFDSPLLIPLGGFVMLMGRMELAALRYREARRRMAVEVLPAGDDVADVLPADGGPAFSGFVWDNRARVWVVWRDGRPVASFSAGSE
jgi:Zn-dependent protease